jgi:hypothetical protein
MKRLIIAVAAVAGTRKQCVFARVPCGSGDAPPTLRSDALSGPLRKRQHAPIPDEISGRPWPVTARSGSGRGAASCSLVRRQIHPTPARNMVRMSQVSPPA